MVRFLNGEGSFIDHLKVIWAMPKTPFSGSFSHPVTPMRKRRMVLSLDSLFTLPLGMLFALQANRLDLGGIPCLPRSHLNYRK